ncbi:unnamed protein product [Toxocara canis]|uniref:Uncharacterized protein n=1 Tax=Toxocara canis TaxID=6265 RepID=A0A183V7Q8_TOXCA|nr:unnamed protein product [Toxocara canis]
MDELTVTGCVSGGATGGQTRPPALGGRSPQSSFDSNGDVGQISVNFMRVNGTIAPFKTLLTSLNNTYSTSVTNQKSSSSSHLSRVASLKKALNANCYSNDALRAKERRLSDTPVVAIEGLSSFVPC